MSILNSYSQQNKPPGQKFRHEYKFLCNVMELEVLKARLSGLMQRDSHVSAKGFYEIRSIYFDDMYNTCYEKNEAGVDPRAKYRIRSYDCLDTRIVLEKKIKERGKTLKHSVLLSREQFDLIMAGHYSEILQQLMKQEEAEPEQPKQTLLKDFLILGLTRMFQPKVIVIYERTPFVEANGNVRVTIDQNIASSTDFVHFFDRDIQKLPVLLAGEHLLEVKYDAFLPAYIKQNLETGRLRQTTFSKYYICRHERIRR